MPFDPQFAISPATAKALMEIESLRVTLSDTLVVTPDLIANLRQSARLLSTHFSTKIEGNRLTAEEVRDAIVSQKGFPGRKRDEKEVLHHYRAAEQMEKFAHSSGKISEREIKIIHGLVMEGKSTPSKYRDGQNVIRDGATGGIVYMPPEADDVASLMSEMVSWINAQIEGLDLPVPVIAALAHYQFATIHPYYDGNGRTARLLTNLILHRAGYGLNGIYSLEEYYAKNLNGYYEALTVGESHNYYLGRAECDVSGFMDYFCVGMAASFRKISKNLLQAPSPSRPAAASLMRELSPLQRQALGLFHESRVATARQLAEYLSIDSRKASRLCVEWSNSEFLTIHDHSKKKRSYRLAKKYEEGLIE